MADPGDPARWHRPVVSARVRIIGWTVGVLALALAALVFVTWQVLSGPVERDGR